MEAKSEEIHAPLLDTNEKKTKCGKMNQLDIWPYFNVLFAIASCVGWYVCCVKMAKQLKVENFWDLLIKVKAEDKQYILRGRFLNMTYIYGFYLLCSILGFLNAVPACRMGLGKKPFFRGFTSWRTLIMFLLIILLNCLWVYTLIKYDMMHFQFKNGKVIFFYKLSSYWLNLLWALSILFCTRNTVYQHIMNSTYTTGISIHKAIGTTAFYTTFVHIVLSLAKKGMKEFPSGGSFQTIYSYIWNTIWHYHDKDINFRNIDFLTSTSMLLKLLPFTLLLMIVALPSIRKHLWEVFYYVHWPVIYVIVFFFMYHSSMLLYHSILPVSLYVIDKLVRWYSIYSRSCRIAKIETYEDMVMLDIEVNSRFCKKYEFANLIGSAVYLNIPAISFFQYHPFSVAYNRGNHLYFYIKCVGKPTSWTGRLLALSDSIRDREVYVEGPYTLLHRGKDRALIESELPKLCKEEDYQGDILLVAGGAGFAGVSAYLYDILNLLKNCEDAFTKQVHVVVVVQHHRHLDCMKSLLLECQSHKWCYLHLYSTYSQDEELRAAMSPIEDDCSILVKGDAESAKKVVYSSGRPQFKSILESLGTEQLSVYYCGPKPLNRTLFKELTRQKKRFIYHSEIFDM